MLCFTMHTMTYADEKRAKYEELVRRDEEIQAFLGTFNETREQGVWVCGYIYVCRGVCVCVCLCVWVGVGVVIVCRRSYLWGGKSDR